jgi:hypothetical protein
MIENMNKLLEKNDVMVRIGTTWYKLEEINPNFPHSVPIFVSDDDGGEHEFDFGDIDEFDPMFEAFKELDWHNVGVA